MPKTYNIKDKNINEVSKIYKKITLKNKVLNKIWNLSNNYEDAINLYKRYEENNKQ